MISTRPDGTMVWYIHGWRGDYFTKAAEDYLDQAEVEAAEETPAEPSAEAAVEVSSEEGENHPEDHDAGHDHDEGGPIRLTPEVMHEFGIEVRVASGGRIARTAAGRFAALFSDN